MKLKTFEHCMPVEGNTSDDLLESTINDFIKNKIVIDIKYSTNLVSISATDYICNSVVVLYEEQESHKVSITAAAEYATI